MQCRVRKTGDPIFKRNSSAYWITPEIDKIDLELTAQERQFKSTEYQGRLKKLKKLHERYLVFSLDLSMPFYSKPQSRLIDYLKNNLTVTLENGTKKIFSPELQVFSVIERLTETVPFMLTLSPGDSVLTTYRSSTSSILPFVKVMVRPL